MSDKDQSALQFLFSKEGRPMLIGVGAMLIIFPLIGWYAYDSLYGGNNAPQTSTPTAQQRASAGSSNVNASGNRTQGNLTSQGLTPEAREALNEYNRQASEQGRMGQPTPDDVVLIDVDENGLPISSDSESTEQNDTSQNEQQAAQRQQSPALPGNNGGRNGNGQNGAGNARAPVMERPDPGVRRTVGNNGIDTQMSGLTREQQERRLNMTPQRLEGALAEHDEYRNRRMQAAVELINFESAPSTINSVSFASQSAGSGAPKPARIRRTGNQTQGTQFEQSDKSGGGNAGVCEYPLVKGGEIRYGVNDIALNTDFQGPVKITFLDGNLRGYVGMGSFELNELGARMKLRIEQIFDPDGNAYSVSGYVLDPQTTLWAMASNVDYHIIYRYGGYGLGTIMSAFQILAENRSQITEVTTDDGRTITENRDPDGKQVTWTMIGEFSELFEEAFRDNINRPITVTLDPNTEVAVLFEETVCELNNESTKRRRAQERRNSLGLGDPLASRRSNY